MLHFARAWRMGFSAAKKDVRGSVVDVSGEHSDLRVLVSSPGMGCSDR